jgi:hypothetical protein
LFYYLGKNPAKAEHLRQLSEQNPVACVLEIGGLVRDLRVKPKHSNPPPDPDTGVGSGDGAGGIKGPAGATFE